MKHIKKILIVTVSILLLAGCDLTSKEIAKNEFKNKPNQSFFGGSLQIIYAENSGGMLNIGSDFSSETRYYIFIIFVSITLLILYIFTLLKKDLSLWYTFSLILILGGGIGNMLNRLTNEGRVIDFLVLNFFNLHTGIFNIADINIMAGLLILIISHLFTKHKHITAD